MANTLKILSTEITLSNTVPNTVSSATLVRLVNLHASVSETINLCHANGSVKATTTVGHTATDSSRLILVKLPSEMIKTTGASPVKAVPIAYS